MTSNLIKWSVKWGLIAIILGVILRIEFQDKRAAEMRLQRIEARLVSLDSLSLLPSLVYRDSADGEIYATPQRPWLVPIQLMQHEDTLLSVFGQHLIIRSTP